MAQPYPQPSGFTPAVETIAGHYTSAARGDAELALRQAIADALADLCEAERRTMRRDRLISRGFVRGSADRAVEALADP